MVYCVESPPQGEFFEFEESVFGESFDHWTQAQIDAEMRANDWYDRSAARYLDQLEQAKPGGRRLLEIGASFGPFIQRAQQRGWDAEGVDASAHAVEAGQKHFNTAVILGTEAAVADRPPHDAVVGLDVIEHQIEPRAFLRRLRPLVRPGGVLLLKTPNHDCLYARLYGPMAMANRIVRRVTGRSLPWASMYYNYEPGQRLQSGHAIHFSRQTLRRALELEGFEIVLDAPEYSDIEYLLSRRPDRSLLTTIGLRLVDGIARLTKSPNKVVMVGRRVAD